MRAVLPLSTASASKVLAITRPGGFSTDAFLPSVFLRTVLEIMTSLVAEASLYWRLLSRGFIHVACPQNSTAGQWLGV
jgi:hypothetical protein